MATPPLNVTESLSALPFETLLGTPLTLATYESLAAFLEKRSALPGVVAVDFSNTHIVTMRRRDAAFRELTGAMDFFVPDGMPLIWCLNAKGAGLEDRVYGPTFMRECLKKSPSHLRHYFLGGNQECLDALLANLKASNPDLTVAGARNGYFRAVEEPAIAEAIRASHADLIWIGLGTPKQQEWIARWKSSFDQGILLAVGFAFDVNAGTKRDAPLWMQRLGMTWVFRLLSEPGRLWKRYLVRNTQFVLLIAGALWSHLTGRNPEP